MSQVLILVLADDSEVFDALVAELTERMGGNVSIHCSTILTDARKFVDTRKPGAIIVDEELKSGGAAAFARSTLRLGRRNPSVFLIGSLDASDPEVIRLLRDFPEVNFIERPFRPEAAARRIRSVLMPQRQSDQSFYGLRLCELIQAFSLGRRDATLMVLTPDGRMGSVALLAGRLVHVAFGELEGLEALLCMVEYKQGEIRIAPDCPTAKRTINKPTQQVLLDVYRRVDEARIAQADAGEEPNPLEAVVGNGSDAGQRQIMDALDALFVHDAPENSAEKASKVTEQKKAPARPPHVKPVEEPTTKTRLIHSTYRGIPPQTFPVGPGLLNEAAAGGSPATQSGFAPKGLKPKSVRQMITEALEDEPKNDK